MYANLPCLCIIYRHYLQIYVCKFTISEVAVSPKNKNMNESLNTPYMCQYYCFIQISQTLLKKKGFMQIYHVRGRSFPVASHQAIVLTQYISHVSPVWVPGWHLLNHWSHPQILLKEKVLHSLDPFCVTFELSLEIVIDIQVMLVDPPKIRIKTYPVLLALY